MKPERKYDTFRLRFEAMLWDGLILLPLKIINALVQDHIKNAFLIITWYALYTFLVLGYIIVLHGKYGQTVGKRKTGVIVLNLEETRIINYKESVIRSMPYVIIWMSDLVLAICYENGIQFNVIVYSILQYWGWAWFAAEIVTALNNSKRRALHDFMAGSVVIRKEFYDGV